MTNFRAVIVSDSTVAVVLWRAWRDSNPRHLVPKTSALSAELQAHAGGGAGVSEGIRTLDLQGHNLAP